MSGIVAIIGRRAIDDGRKMLEAIDHRGPAIKGFAEIGNCVVGQNYLAADINGPYEKQSVPVALAQPTLRVLGFDGQIGNRLAMVRSMNMAQGAFEEERLVLELYSRFGTSMFDYLGDAVFAFLIVDEQKGILAGRDLLGIKTLFYTKKDGTIYLASEIKALLAVNDEVHEFPAGHYMDGDGNFTAFAALPQQPPAQLHTDEQQCMTHIRQTIVQSVSDRIDFKSKTGSLLSGGIDSSVIAMLASRLYKEKFGSVAQLPTFALGVGESNDIINARLVSQHIDSQHHELIVDLDQVIDALDRTIYYLESFDPSLVRSAVSNYLISRYAHGQGIEVLLSGEGGDEVFCGYMYLKNLALEEQFKGQIDCLKFLHNNASLRLESHESVQSNQSRRPVDFRRPAQLRPCHGPGIEAEA